LKSRDIDPLSRRHFKQVIRRPVFLKAKMANVIGITWNLKGRLIAPLGSSSMLAQFGEGEKPIQTCITGVFDPETAVVEYVNQRMRHDWSRNPYYGARGATLDPREPGSPGTVPGDHPNASWVRLGLAVDAYRADHCRQTHLLPAAPTLPRF